MTRRRPCAFRKSLAEGIRAGRHERSRLPIWRRLRSHVWPRRGRIETAARGGSEIVPWGGKTLTGTAACEQFFGDLLELFEPESFEPKKYVAQGDTVVALGDFRFRTRRTGKSYETDWAMAWTFRDGKAVECRVYEDTEAQATSLAAD